MFNGRCDICGRAVDCLFVTDQEPGCCVFCSNRVKDAREQRKKMRGEALVEKE